MLKRNRKMFGILIAIMLGIVLMLSLILASCSPKKREDTKLKNDEKLVGYDVELAQAVSKELGMHFHAKEIVWKNKIIDVRGRKIDAIWNGMTLTNELKSNENLCFSQPYMKNKQVIIVKTSVADKINSVGGLKKVIVEGGSAGESIVDKNTVLAPKKEALESQADAIRNVFLSSDDAKIGAVVDALYGEFLINNESSDYKGKLVVKELEGFEADEEQYAIAFSKENEYLKYKIEKALFNLQQSGKINQIAEKYGVEARVLKINDPGNKTEKDFSKESVKRYNQIKEIDGGFFIGYTLYEPMAYIEKK